MYMSALDGEDAFFELAGLQSWQRTKRRARSAGALRTSAAIAELFDSALQQQTEAVLFQTALAGAESQHFYRPSAWPPGRKIAPSLRSPAVQGDIEAQMWASCRERTEKMQALARCLPKDRAQDALLTACAAGDKVLYLALRERNQGLAYLMCCEQMTRKTPLHLAAQHGHLEICKDLVESLVDVNVSDNFGRSPLYLACKYAKAHMIPLLMQSKALPEQEDRDQRSAFHLSLLCSDPKISWMLLQVHPRLALLADGHGRTGLHYALLNIHRRQWTGSTARSVMKHLLDNTADVNALDCYSRTPLWYAAQRGMAHSVAMLLDHHANPELRDCDGKAPLDVVQGAAGAQLAAGSGDHAADAARAEAALCKAGMYDVDFMDSASELEQMHAAIAKREALIQDLEAKLQDRSAEQEHLKSPPLVDVTGSWVFDDGHSMVKLNQDSDNGNVSGEVDTPGRIPLAFQGKVTSNQLVYELGAQGRTTKFALDWQQEGSVLSGTWMDYRGTSGSQRLLRQGVRSEQS